MTKVSRILFGLAVLGGATLTFLSPSSLSAQQQVAVDNLSDFRRLPRTSHAACLDCFTIARAESYDIFEELPGTGAIIKRNLPNPAPLEPDEKRLEFDPDTGLPIWYIGRQPYVGPTDLEPWSSKYPRPLIELKRIHARHQDRIFSIPGVHSFGVGEIGFVVSLLPEYSGSANLIPKTIEKVPVEVLIEEMARAQSHANTRYAPVPVGSGIESTQGPGTLGPHIVRIAGGETRIHSLTAAHVVKFVDQPHVGNLVRQPRLSAPGSRAWGTVVHSFQMTPCNIPTDPNCNRTGAPINNTWVNPDVAAIQNFTAADFFPHTSPANSDEPIRRLQYGATNYVNGPSGIIVSPSYGASAKLWGVNTDAPVGAIRNSVMRVFDYQTATGTKKFKMQWLCEVIYERNPQGGDSGALVSGNGAGNRHVYGVHIGGPLLGGGAGYHVPAGDIYTAFSSSNFPFNHYWGTQSSRGDLWFPAQTQCDGSC